LWEGARGREPLDCGWIAREELRYVTVAERTPVSEDYAAQMSFKFTGEP
jgi:hypothetical protein